MIISGALSEKINNLILTVKEDGRISYVGPSVKLIQGFNSTQLMGFGWWKRVFANFLDSAESKKKAIQQPRQQAFYDRIPYKSDIVDANGNKRTILWNSSRGEGNILTFIGQNISGKKQAELTLAEKHREQITHFTKNMLESILYASKIQEGFLQEQGYLRTLFNDGFVLMFYQWMNSPMTWRWRIVYGNNKRIN